MKRLQRAGTGAATAALLPETGREKLPALYMSRAGLIPLQQLSWVNRKSNPSMISRRHNFIFVHMPKTGGNALSALLAPYSEGSEIRVDKRNRHFHDGVERFGVRVKGTSLRKHSPIQDYLEELGEKFLEEATKFTIVRNPWDRAISYYFFEPTKRPANTEGAALDLPFDPEAFLTRAKRIKPASTYLCVKSKGKSRSIKEHAMDVILKNETMQEDFNALAAKLGIPSAEIAKRNVGYHRHYTEYYTPELQRAVGEVFADEIEQFGYKFGA